MATLHGRGEAVMSSVCLCRREQGLENGFVVVLPTSLAFCLQLGVVLCALFLVLDWAQFLFNVPGTLHPGHLREKL